MTGASRWSSTRPPAGGVLTLTQAQAMATALLDLAAKGQGATDCPDWCQSKPHDDPDEPHTFAAVPSHMGGCDVLVSTLVDEHDASVVYLTAGDLVLTAGQANAAGLALVAAAGWAKDHEATSD